MHFSSNYTATHSTQHNKQQQRQQQRHPKHPKHQIYTQISILFKIVPSALVLKPLYDRRTLLLLLLSSFLSRSKESGPSFDHFSRPSFFRLTVSPLFFFFFIFSCRWPHLLLLLLLAVIFLCCRQCPPPPPPPLPVIFLLNCPLLSLVNSIARLFLLSATTTDQKKGAFFLYTQDFRTLDRTVPYRTVPYRTIPYSSHKQKENEMARQFITRERPLRRILLQALLWSAIISAVLLYFLLTQSSVGGQLQQWFASITSNNNLEQLDSNSLNLKIF